MNYNHIPKTIRLILRPIYIIYKSIIYLLLDYSDLLKGNKNPFIPPRRMRFSTGLGDYKKIGDEFMEYFKEFGLLRPNAKVLEVGCGLGRMSIPLINFLSKDGEYHGFDIVKKWIHWCKKNITSRKPNFKFEHSDIWNKMYNPKGIEKASNYKFNYSNNYFDFVFLTSVFTHMHTEDIDRYLEEISRVMKTNGRCLITFFLMNAESIALMKNKKAIQNIIYKIDNNSYTENINIPESTIGFNEEYINELFDKNGLNIIQPIHYGSWCGRNKFTSYQDIIVAEKKLHITNTSK